MRRHYCHVPAVTVADWTASQRTVYHYHEERVIYLEVPLQEATEVTGAFDVQSGITL